MPGASAPAAARVVVVNTRVSHHGYAETPGIPARNGFNGLLRALLGDQDLLVTVAGGIASADLTPTSRRQDHTASPYASASFVSRAAASTASRPYVRDDGQRPSSGRDGGSCKSDLGLWRSGIFLLTGLDRKITGQPVGQISKRARMTAKSAVHG